MIKKLNFLFILVILTSCGSGIKINKKDFSPIDKNFNNSFENKSHLTKGLINYNENKTILEYFEINKKNIDSVYFYFNRNNDLILTFRDSLKTFKEIFSGKFKNKGYYEIFIRNYKKEIPPFVPFIYGTRDIKRLRIGFTKDNELVIDNKWARDRNIFILSGGGSGRYRSYFKLIKKN